MKLPGVKNQFNPSMPLEQNLKILEDLAKNKETGLLPTKSIDSDVWESVCAGFIESYEDGLQGEAHKYRQELKKHNKEVHKKKQQYKALTKKIKYMEKNRDILRAAESIDANYQRHVVSSFFDIAKAKKSVLKCSFAGAEGLEKNNSWLLRREFHNAMWFDFSAIDTGQTANNSEMSDFGQELYEEGFAKLPYDDCVFSFTIQSQDQLYFRSFWLKNNDDGIDVLASHTMEKNGKAFIVSVSFDGDHVDTIETDDSYLGIGILASREIERVPIGRDGQQVAPGSSAETSYTRVIISPNYARNSLGGTHASPRVHMRRGHVRKYQDGRKTWVRPTLVNAHKADQAGAVIHDYEVRK